MIGALHGTVPGNVGADDGFNAQVLELFAEGIGGETGCFGPALDGHKTIL